MNKLSDQIFACYAYQKYVFMVKQLNTQRFEMKGAEFLVVFLSNNDH